MAVPCSCLDSAYERHAIEQGLNKNPVFPENVQYLQEFLIWKECISITGKYIIHE